jgi:hypothetical protein
MFDFSNPDTLWLNVTNLAFAVAIAFCLGLTLIGGAVGLVARLRSGLSLWSDVFKRHDFQVFHPRRSPPRFHTRRILRQSDQ